MSALVVYGDSPLRSSWVRTRSLPAGLCLSERTPKAPVLDVQPLSARGLRPHICLWQVNERHAPRPALAGCKGGDHRSRPDKAGQLQAVALPMRCHSCHCVRASLLPTISLAPYLCTTSCLDAGQRSPSKRWLWLENNISAYSWDRKKSLARAGSAVACTGWRVMASQPHATDLSVACVLAAGRLRAHFFN